MVAISIIVPTRDRSAALVRAVQTVINQDFPKTDYEILIVDNNSTSSMRPFAEEVIRANPGHSIRYFHEPIPGLLSGRHRGAAESRGGILVFIDDDIEADRGWLAAIHEAFREPEVHLVGGRNLPNFEVPPPPWIEHIWEKGPDYATLYSGTYSLIDFGEARREIDANHVWGLNFSIRKETLYRLGGFHPDVAPKQFRRFIGDGETGLTIKAKEHGLKAVYEPRALVRHLVSAERMTIRYVEQRHYFQGIFDSYTAIRQTRKIGFLYHASEFPETEKQTIPYRIQSAYTCGYNYHQREVRRDPKLLSWVLRANYFDYRYPE